MWFDSGRKASPRDTLSLAWLDWTRNLLSFLFETTQTPQSGTETVHPTDASQDDFFYFICDAITARFLKPGDVLVMDNAAVHSGSEIIHDLKKLAEMFRVDLRFLPAYSPEVTIFSTDLILPTVQSLRACLRECQELASFLQKYRSHTFERHPASVCSHLTCRSLGLLQ